MDEAKIDKRQIVREAVLLLQEEGIEKLTMRKLAARLGIRAPTLYWYFPDRSSILRQVIVELLDEAMGGIPVCETWQEWMFAFGQALWKANRDAAFSTLLLQSAEVNDATVVEKVLSVLRERSRKFGVDERIFLRAHSDVNALVVGYAVFWHARVTDQLAGLFHIDRAIDEGLTMIIRNWEAKAADEVQKSADIPSKRRKQAAVR